MPDIAFKPILHRHAVHMAELLGEAKAIAHRCYALTKKSLGIAGEVAEYEAARVLGIKLAPARQAGHDATSAPEIWEADRAAVLTALAAPGSKARNGALGVARLKSIGRLRWPLPA